MEGAPWGGNMFVFFYWGVCDPNFYQGRPPWNVINWGMRNAICMKGEHLPTPTPQESGLVDLGHKNIKASSFWNVLFLMFLKRLERYFKITKTFLTTFKGYKEKVFLECST